MDADAHDRIILEGMVFHGRHGVLPAERELGQPFVVDVELRLDLRPAGLSDAARTVGRPTPGLPHPRCRPRAPGFQVPGLIGRAANRGSGLCVLVFEGASTKMVRLRDDLGRRGVDTSVAHERREEDRPGEHAPDGRGGSYPPSGFR
jgi:hypothetical protein